MNRHNVLFVDDEINILNSIKRLLRAENYNLITATNGAEALSVLEKREDVHLIISDYRMPKMDGIEFLLKAKEIRPFAVRVILSGYADSSSIVNAINSGKIYYFLTKPWQGYDIKVPIRQCLEHHDLLEENRNLVAKLSQYNKELQIEVNNRTHSLEFAQQILMRLPFPIIGIGSEGMVAFVNKAAFNFSAWPFLLSLGKNISDVFPDKLEKTVCQYLENKRSGTEKYTLKEKTFYIRIEPLEDASSFRGLILIFEEAT
ncbi:MAG: response regulator [Deltaproteobacteria bacterium]|nr:response regulator [Deltaproteobacteria bacterium]